MALAPPGGENPSAAFLAGQQHGTRLALDYGVKRIAIQHNTPTKPGPILYNGKPGIPDLSPTQHNAAPNKPGSSPAAVTLNSILAQAQAMAASDTQAQVAALQGQQQAYNQQAQQRASQIGLASQAAAKFLAGIGDNTASSYNNAAQLLAGIAGGYSGDLRNTATDAATQIQQQLAGLGAPTDSLKTATGQTPQPQAISNVLYGLGGALPANLLVTSGQAAAAAQRGLPASTLGYGQQQALGTLAAGQQQADGLAPQIVAARAGQSKLAQQYLQSIQSQLTSNALAQSLIGSRATSAQTAQGNLTLAQQRLQFQQQNADRNYQLAVDRLNKTDTTSATKASPSLSKSFGYLVDGSGNALLQNGKKVMLPNQPKGPTVTSQKQAAEAFGSARYYHQAWQGKDASGKVVTNPPLRWSAWLNAGLMRGIPAVTLIKQGRRIYTPAEIKNDSQPGYTPGG